MELVFVIFCILVVTGCFWLIFIGVDDQQYPVSATGGIVLLAMGIFIGIICVAHIHNGTPTAMDVYQGKTTLKISYVDSVAVDSTVIFKEHE